MLQLYNFDDLAKARLPPNVEEVARKELATLLELSGGRRIDNEYGHVVVLTEDSTDDDRESVLGRPIEGVVCRQRCFVVYLAGGGNERLVAVVCPEKLLSGKWKRKLEAEMGPTGREGEHECADEHP